MELPVIQDYLARAETELQRNILPFWMRHVVDPERGSFHGALSNDLAVDRTVPRGALLTTRILWTFAAAHRHQPDGACLQMADRAYGDLMERFWDREHGGLFWSIDAEGAPLEKRKQIYGQAFGIYALTEYHRASGRREPLEQATGLHQLIEAHSRDRAHGGYFEAFARDWSPIDDVRLSAVDLNEPKSQNTHLHVMEAYTNLLRVWPDPELRRAQTALLEVMLTRILDARTHHLALFFSTDWQVRSDRISFGHDIEASWLMMEAAEVLGDEALSARIKAAALRMAEVTLAEGVDTDGALYNEAGPRGLTDTNKEWWPQAEAVVGFLNAYQAGGGERFAQAALRAWDFIEARLIDRKHGEWFRGVTREGAVLGDQLKVSFWKCPYHNGRTCLEMADRLRALAAKRGPQISADP